jgi:alpha,alpha-trehalose phosphorylase
LSPRHRRLQVEVSAASATYTLLEGEPLGIAHHGDHFVITVGKPLIRVIPPAPARPRPRQPPGRETQH